MIPLNFEKYLIYPTFSGTHTHPFRYVLEKAMDFIPTNRDYVNILDVGFGDGWSLTELKHRFPQSFIFGLTFNQQELEFFEKNFKVSQTQAFYGDMHNMSFESKFFDLVYSRDNFEHSISPYIALLEFKRILKDDGYILITIPGEEWTEEPEHITLLNKRQMLHLIQICGLKLKDYQYSEYPEAAVNQHRYLIEK